MDQGKTKLELHHRSNDQREMTEVDVKDTSGARKVQKADREKLRRDKLNEQFIELGNALDPDRPKNDKASIITDTIQMLKDLTKEVNRLKAEYAALSDESCELTQEKNEVRKEKLSLKSDIENLNLQYQQRVRVMCPWGGINPSSVVMHPFQFFAGAVPTSSPSFMSYPNQTVSICAPSPTTYSVSKQESGSKSSDCFRDRNDEKEDNSSDVVTELQLKTPGSRSGQVKSVMDNNGRV